MIKEKAFEIEKEIMEDDMCPYIEYGICYLEEYESFN